MAGRSPEGADPLSDGLVRELPADLHCCQKHNVLPVQSPDFVSYRSTTLRPYSNHIAAVARRLEHDTWPGNERYRMGYRPRNDPKSVRASGTSSAVQRKTHCEASTMFGGVLSVLDCPRTSRMLLLIIQCPQRQSGKSASRSPCATGRHPRWSGRRLGSTPEPDRLSLTRARSRRCQAHHR